MTRRRAVPRLVQAVAISVVVTALVQELRKPPATRTWHGTVAGVVPYDFRMPTVDRAKERFWAPQDPRILVPQVFGVGWTLNLGRLIALLRHHRG
jgi:hypothetical protein